MNILILGGTGAMGNDLIKILKNNENDVVVTSRNLHISEQNVHFVQGDAMDILFLKQMLCKSYDVIVDFMSYTTEMFKSRVDMFLEKTGQYVFISSCRVYAESNMPINENSPRIIDICEDKKYLNTDEYALAKARQEDILKNSGKKNWTIVRPYITYSDIRLQLGFMEKELWLYRVLKGKPLIVGKDILNKMTTLTCGQDVSNAIAELIGFTDALGDIFNIMQSHTIKWSDVLDLYLNVIESKTGARPIVILEDKSDKEAKYCGRSYQMKYDRLYDRVFDNSKILSICPSIHQAVRAEEGLRKCLGNFLDGDRVFRDMSWSFEGYADKVSHTRTELNEIYKFKEKIKYLLARYTAYYER